MITMSENVLDISTMEKVEESEGKSSPAPATDAALPPPAPPAARPSGLRPPSKIGRLCAGGPHKPAIPSSPKNNGSTTAMMNRRFSDDYTRKHLADVQEADEELESGFLYAMGDYKYPPRERKPSTCSTYSVTSMDALWENHPRRLSEAGLRRTSDHSVVLTEDTDSFIIGDRVWVGGSKPGQIAYIGETQFAPGEWAGVVLDEPIGKNDGSVAGVRYFQCESRRGVFSRLTRLTHEPLATASPASPSSELAGSVNGGSRPPSALRTPSSPGPKVPSSPGPRATPTRTRRSSSPNGSMRSMGSRMSTSTIAAEIRIGDRVIVSSSQGSKAGILRYMGPTEFAQGQWCGVELDDPIGKNDGSVEGKRYFECGPRFGLFAPQSKVSRSPSNRRPTSCAVHGSRVNSPPESTASLASSVIGSVTRPRLGVTSLVGADAAVGQEGRAQQRLSGPRVTSTPMSAKNTLQELLREKQQHIEKLIKEHEVERGELAKITLQMDRVQTALIASQKENSQLVKEIDKMKTEYKTISTQLEDEKQKVEDLMFRAEEDNIHKEDFTKEKDKLSTNVLSLESELEISKRQIEELQAQYVLLQGQHKADNDILSAQHKDEVQAAHALAAELQKLLDEAHMLLREKDGEKELLSKSHIEEVNKTKMDFEKTVNEIKSKLTETQLESSEEIKLLKENLVEATNKINAQNENKEKLSIEYNNLISDLRTQIDQKQKLVDEKTQEIIKVTASSKENEISLIKELEKVKMNLSGKILDVETLTESNKELNDVLKNVKMEYETLKVDLISKTSEIEALSSSTAEHNGFLQNELDKLRTFLNEKQAEIETIKSQSKDLKIAFEKEIETHQENISVFIKEIDNLKREIDNVNHEHSMKQDQVNNEISEKNNCIKSLDTKLAESLKSLEEAKGNNRVLEIKNNSSEDEVKKLNDMLTQKQQDSSVLSTNIEILNTKLSQMELDCGDFSRKLRDEIEKGLEIQRHREKLENELSNVNSKSTSSDEQINILTSKLKETEKELGNLKESNRDKVSELERKEQEVMQQLEKMQIENENLKCKLTQGMSILEETKKNYDKKIQQLDEKLLKVQEESTKTIAEIELKHQTTIEKLIKDVDSKNEENEYLKQQYNQLNHDTSSTINDLNHRLEILQESGQTSESQLKEKLNELITIQNELNQKLEASQSNEKNLQDINQKSEEELKSIKVALEITIKNGNEKSSLLNEEIHRLQNEHDAYKNTLIEKDNILKDLQQKVALCELEIKSNLDVITEKDRQITTNNSELKKALDEKYEVEKKLSDGITEIGNVQQKVENLVDEVSCKNSKIEEQEGLIMKYKEQIQNIISDKNNLENETQQSSEHLNSLRSQNEKLNNQVLCLEKSIVEVNTEKNIKDEKIKALEIEITNLKGIDTSLRKTQEECISHLKDIENKNSIIAQLNERINSLKKDVSKDNSDKEQKVRLLENEIAEIKTIHLHEIGEMKKSHHSLQCEKEDMEKKLLELEYANNKIVTLKEQVEKSNEDIQKLTTLNEAQKKNYDQLNIQMHDEYEKLKSETKKDRKQLKERLKASESTCFDYSKQLDQEKLLTKDLQLRIDESNNLIKELQNRIQYLEVSSEKKAGEEKSELQKLLLELQSCHKAHDEESKQLKSEINVLNEQISKKTCDSTKYSNHITSLENDIKRYKSQNEALVQEIAQLTNEIKECQKSLVKPDLNSNNNVQKPQIMDTDAKRLLEEKEEVVGQVNFLNSVIVDMQRKNEELKARVEVLEMGCTPQEADEYNFNGLKTRQVAPRMYCDICDVFDAHETEDCPRQTTDVDAPAPASEKKRTLPAPRPYCDICEVFGHATEDCDEEETY